MSTVPGAPRPLVVRIRNWIGDVVLGLPALQLLQDQGYQLHLVARGAWAPALLAAHGWPVLVQPQGFAAKVAQLRALGDQCRALDPGFDGRENAFLLPVSFSSALELRSAGLRAVGVAKEGRSPLLARAEPWATSGHELLRYLDIACRFVRRQVPPPAEIGLQVHADAAAEATAMLAQAGLQGRYLMICPFAGGKAATADKADKRWPGFAEFARRAEQQLGLPVAVYPGPGEHAEAQRLYPAARLLQGGTLATYMALLQRARLVVANDTGPGHIAAALGRPLISVLGAADAARWAPWGRNVHVLQRPSQGGQTVWPGPDEALALAARLLADG